MKENAKIYNTGMLPLHAFAKMDLALDFAILFKLSESPDFESLDYKNSEFSETWVTLKPHQSKILD